MSHPRLLRAFTLIELLVVISVILILAALVMPAVVGAMKSATSANCVSNLRQVATGFTLYYKHYDGFMTASGSPGAGPPHRFPHFCKNIEPFVTDPGIFRCPAKDAEYGYGLNHMWCGPDHIFGSGTAMNDRSKEITQVVNPSKTVIICDTGFVSNKDAPLNEWVETADSNTNGCCRFPYDNVFGKPGNFIWWSKDPRRPFPRHGAKKTNCMFFDGHVESIVTADIIDDLWDEPACIYDNDGHPKRK